MRRIAFTLFFVLSLPIIITPGRSTTFHAVRFRAPHPLSYVQSSWGLDYPAWDGGRSELEFGDVDNDGNIDIVTIGDHGSPYVNTDEHGIMVYFGDGTGSWNVFMNGEFGYGGVCLGDVDNDGHMDVGYAMHHNYSADDFGDQLIEVALGDGTGQNWTPWDDSLATNGESWGMFCTDFADVDNDGFLDIVSNSFGSGSGIHVYLNRADGTWSQSFGFLSSWNSSMDVVFGDANSDGNADFAAAHQWGTVYIGDGAGGFSLSDGNLPPQTQGIRHGPDFGDIDNDGYQDLSFVNSENGVEVWRFVDINVWEEASDGLPATGDFELTQLCDMNMDGNMDLVAAGHGTVTVWRGDGTGNWTQAAELTVPGTPGYINALRTGADVDHNGYPDIVLLDQEGPWYDQINHLRCYLEASSESGLSIRITSPRMYETLKLGSASFIEWVSREQVGPSTVDLELSTTGPEGPWTALATEIPNNGRYQWTVTAHSSSSACHLRATVTDGQEERMSVTPLPFSIVE